MTNIEKSVVAPIRCGHLDINATLTSFPAAISQFPLKYLGLPLSLGRLRRVDLQPYIDKVASRLNPAKVRFLNRAGCDTLVKSVLTALPIFLLTAIKADKATLKTFDKLRRGMLWGATEAVSGGKCKVAWAKVCRPKKLGGLGILELDKFARALRLRWLWYEWKAPDKPWVGLETPNDDTDRDLFNAATIVTVGDGRTASFWSSSWLNGTTPKSIAPKIFEASKKKKRCVKDALNNLTWVADIAVNDFTLEHMAQFVSLWEHLQNITLQPNTADSISWALTSDGIYSAASAYKAQFIGSNLCSFDNLVWKTWAPPKCRFFAWLVVQNRLWTSDRLAIRGWPHSPLCQLCKCQGETARHILFDCRYSRRIWLAAASWLSCPSLVQDLGTGRATVLDFWKAGIRSPTAHPKGLKSAFMLITWEIWKERNARVFNNTSLMPSALVQKIKDEAKNWILAGDKHLAAIVE